MMLPVPKRAMRVTCHLPIPPCSQRITLQLLLRRRSRHHFPLSNYPVTMIETLPFFVLISIITAARKKNGIVPGWRFPPQRQNKNCIALLLQLLPIVVKRVDCASMTVRILRTEPFCIWERIVTVHGSPHKTPFRMSFVERVLRRMISFVPKPATSVID